MKALICLLTAPFLLGCTDSTTQRNKKLTSDIKTYLQSEMDSTGKSLDSLQIVGFDTITPKHLLAQQYADLEKDLAMLEEMYQLNSKSVDLSIEQIKLYGSIGSPELVKMEKETGLAQLAKLKEMMTEKQKANKFLDSLAGLIRLADTTKLIAIQVKCFAQIRNSDRSVDRDTTLVLINSNNDIIKLASFYKPFYKIQFENY